MTYWTVLEYYLTNERNYPLHMLVEVQGEKFPCFWRLPIDSLNSEQFDWTKSKQITKEQFWRNKWNK